MTLKQYASFRSDGLMEAFGHKKYKYDQQKRLIEINDKFSFPKGSSLESKIIFKFNNDG